MVCFADDWALFLSERFNPAALHGAEPCAGLEYANDTSEQRINGTEEDGISKNSGIQMLDHFRDLCVVDLSVFDQSAIRAAKTIRLELEFPVSGKGKN